MWTFQYKHGDRPLEGYTIQRAAGRGGFGEVYLCGQRQRARGALKAVQGYEQIELRGISQCMNLKSAASGDDFRCQIQRLGRPFVIMEFVAGPILRQLLDSRRRVWGRKRRRFSCAKSARG